jgi:hypothetical protein
MRTDENYLAEEAFILVRHCRLSYADILGLNPIERRRFIDFRLKETSKQDDNTPK